jgi:hypothetical protein
MRSHILALSAAALLCAAPVQAQPAQPAQCPPLTRVFTLDLNSSPGGGRYAAPVTVNGQQKQFLLSTSNPASRLSRAVMNELKLSPRQLGQQFSSAGRVENA